MPPNAPGLIPFVLGVTGHRDLRLEDTPRLEAAVLEVLAGIRQASPSSPMVVVSALAEGADRLVARVGLGAGARLAVVLPMPREQYQQDFATAESRAEFANLLAQAESVFIAPAVGPRGAPDATAQRVQQYAAAGMYIACHSHLLLALWDGKHKEKFGGTAHIVRVRLEGLRETPGEGLHVPDQGAVYHIVTPRRSRPELPNQPFAVRRLAPPAESPREHGATHCRSHTSGISRIELFREQEDFNREVLRLLPTLKERVRESATALIPAQKAAILSPHARRLLDHYAVADALAVHFQKRRRRAWFSLCSLGVLAVISFAGNDLAGEGGGPIRHGLFLAGYLVLVAVGFSAYKLAEGRAWQSRHLDYRALAEGLRVQFFWCLAGIDQEVADQYLRKQRTELEWIRQAIRACNLPAAEKAATPTGPTNNLWALAGPCWLQDQRRYFTETRQENQAALRLRKRLAKTLLVTALLLVLLMVLIDLFAPSDANHGFGNWLSHSLGAASAILLAFAGAFEVYSEKLALAEQTKQYGQMAHVFTLATERFEACLAGSDQESARRLLLALGREALIENGDWVMLHRARELEVRIG